jgi:hypothetical protein
MSLCIIPRLIPRCAAMLLVVRCWWPTALGQVESGLKVAMVTQCNGGTIRPEVYATGGVLGRVLQVRGGAGAVCNGRCWAGMGGAGVCMVIGLCSTLGRCLRPADNDNSEASGWQ